MNDRYLFKAKRLDNGEWVKGSLVYDNRDKMYRIIIEIDYFTGTCITADNAPRVDSSTICQCTGLKDKNGELIFENDIIERLDIHDIKEPSIGIIEYDVENTSFLIHWTDIANYSPTFHWKNRIGVIGNIFDNPKLLESEE
ncbi:MAG: YopX family protein [Agathobacter rectalis]